MSTQHTPDTEGLKQLAMEATQGLWNVVAGHYPSFIKIEGPSFQVSIVVHATDLSFADGMQRRFDADYIAAANPSAILALVERLEKAEQQRDELRDALVKYGKHSPTGAPICMADVHSDFPCSCGFDEAIAKARGQQS